MNSHRLVNSVETEIIPVNPPYSFFSHIEQHYSAITPAIGRLFSLARSEKAESLIVEKIEPVGIIADENDEIKEYYPDHEITGLERISFWKSNVSDIDSTENNGEGCIGYAILKRDVVPSLDYDQWHVFESVIKKYPHEHNCVPKPFQYDITIGSGKITIEGLLYAQQNGLNKACAQVALRSLLSRVKQNDISYREINDVCRLDKGMEFVPSKGMRTRHIRRVLEKYGIPFRDFEYTQHSKDARSLYPYQNFVYAGIESGVGALVGFRLTGRETTGDEKHIIPFYGHTFNKDTWAPEADIAYFKVGESVGYVPSGHWTSSFLGHDDNFGPNFCVPRLYINNDQVDYVVELLNPGTAYSGVQAEALSLKFLYSVLQRMQDPENPWLYRLAFFARPDVQRVVLRAINMKRDEYISHLSTINDWDGNTERVKVIEVLNRYLPDNLWIVEISIPQLFPANQRKLGDIVLDGGLKLKEGHRDYSHFVFARFPGIYYFAQSTDPNDPNFLSVPSNLASHVDVYRL